MLLYVFTRYLIEIKNKVRCQAGRYGICDGKVALGQVLFRGLGLSLSLSFEQGASHFLFVCHRCYVVLLNDSDFKTLLSFFLRNRPNGFRSKPTLRCITLKETKG